jgi:hypothetical protein
LGIFSYRRRGYDGLWDRRRQRPSPHCAPIAEVARIARLYREQYAGFNAAHFHEIAQRDHAVTLNQRAARYRSRSAGGLFSPHHKATQRPYHCGD